jgi:hypothetical protein
MAEGHSNAAIATRLVINALFGKLGLPPSAHSHRRVLAVLNYLDHR